MISISKIAMCNSLVVGLSAVLRLKKTIMGYNLRISSIDILPVYHALNPIKGKTLDSEIETD